MVTGHVDAIHAFGSISASLRRRGRPVKKTYPNLGNVTVRMAPADCEWAGWLDLGDMVAIAYGPFGDYTGAANPRNSARDRPPT